VSIRTRNAVLIGTSIPSSIENLTNVIHVVLSVGIGRKSQRRVRMNPELVVLVQEQAAKDFVDFVMRVPVVGGPLNVTIDREERVAIAIVANAIRHAQWIASTVSGERGQSEENRHVIGG
jgi:hypothetical protein